MTILTVGWTGAYSIGHMPQDASYVAETPLTVGWTGKVSTYVLPYELEDLTVRPGVPDPVVDPPGGGGQPGGGVVNPPTGPAPLPPGTIGGGAPGTGNAPSPAPAPPSGTVRPAARPKITVQARVNPVVFRAKGIRVKITLSERAKVEVYATARAKKRLSRRRTTTVKRTITRKRTLTLKAGTTALRIAPSSAGRASVGPRGRLNATVTLKTRFRDGRLVTVNRAVLIARNTKS
jgi:hypothetical protein